MRGGGPYVEVQKTPGSTTWYNAYILDVAEESIHVEFEDDIWPAGPYPTSSVRRCPSPKADVGFQPKVDEPLEAWVSATETSPSGWALGRLKKIKSKSFYFVTLDGPSKGPVEVIMQRESVRRVSTEPTIDSSSLVRKLIPVDRDLREWIWSQDSLGCLNDVMMRSNLLVATCTQGKPDSKGPPKVSLIGDERAVDLGEKLLVEIHFKHQKTMQRFHIHRDKLMEHLSQKESHFNPEHVEVFTINSVFVGRIIGRKGENIRRIKEENEVSVLVQDPMEGDRSNLSTITVTGLTLESVRKAREEIEIIVVKVPIEPDQVGGIVGKSYTNLKDIAKKTELQYARFDDRSGSIELCGLRSQVEDAKMMISVHRDYHLVYQEMSEERSTIKKQFEALDELDGRGGAKKGGKAAGRRGAARGRGGGARGGAGRGGGAQEAVEEEEQEWPAVWSRGGSGGRRPAGGRGRKGGGK